MAFFVSNLHQKLKGSLYSLLEEKRSSWTYEIQKRKFSHNDSIDAMRVKKAKGQRQKQANILIMGGSVTLASLP